MDIIPSTQQTFTDVPYSNAFWLFVERAYSHGVISGYYCGGPGEPCDPANRLYFLPYRSITRGQIAKIDTLAAGCTDSIPPSRHTFVDVPNLSWDWLYVERVYAHGVVGGYDGDGMRVNRCTGQVEQDGAFYFRDCNNATRAQVSKFVYLSFYVDCQTPRKTDN